MRQTRLTRNKESLFQQDFTSSKASEEKRINDDTYLASQSQKLFAAIQRTRPLEKRASSQLSQRCDRLLEDNGIMRDFRKSKFNIQPRSTMRSTYCTSREQLSRSQQENSFLDTTPNGCADLVFADQLRRTQRDRSKDLGACAFRHRDNTAERLLKAELSVLNLKPKPNTPMQYQRTRQSLFMPDVVKFYLPEGGQQIIEPDSKWEKYIPFVKSPKALHAHLHQRTQYKSIQSVLHSEDKIDLSDLQIQERVKQIQKIVNRKRRKSVRDAFLNLLTDKYVSDTYNKQKLLKLKRTELAQESEEDDPQANIGDFKKATWDLLREVNVIRRPSVQVRGPLQVESQFHSYRKLMSSKQ